MSVEAVQQVAAYQGSTHTVKNEKDREKVRGDTITTENKANTVLDTEQEETEQIAKDNERVKKAVQEMNKKANGTTEVRYGIHDKTNRIIIKIVDKQTDKVVKEYPPEETLDIVAKVLELAGIIVDKKM